MFEGGASDIMKEAGDSLFFIMSKMPDNEGDAEAMLKNGVKMLVSEEGGVI